MAKDSNFERASSLYDLLKRRPLSERPIIISHLREASNTAAVEIIERNID